MNMATDDIYGRSCWVVVDRHGREYWLEFLKKTAMETAVHGLGQPWRVCEKEGWKCVKGRVQWKRQ